MFKAVVIVQARLSSSRLPAKVLLNIGAKSVIETIARRLISSKYDLIFAVPHGDEGALIQAQINKITNHNIRIVFGSLNNVLERFKAAAGEYGDNDIIVRLTADNLLPDHLFVEELLQQYRSGYGYSAINDTIYGLSAEVFQKKHLDDAYLHAETDYQIEHVTPYIRKHYSITNITHECDLKYKLRLTLDNIHDFVKLSKLFSHFEEPTKVSWRELVKKSYDIFPPEKKLMIGTAQFGMNYGVANKSGQIQPEEVSNIINHANDNSVFAYDTAVDYGDSEIVLGDNADILANSRIITKLGAKLESYSDVECCLRESCTKLKRSKLNGVLLHNFEQLSTDVWKHLREFKKQGLVEHIGVSVYSKEEALLTVQEGNSDIIQIPYNILDWRWLDLFNEYSHRIAVYARSIFLQGLLLNDEVLTRRGFSDIGKTLDRLVNEFGRENRTDLCIAYVKSQKFIDYVLIGIDDLEQAKQDIAYFDSPNLNCAEIREINDTFKNTPIELLDIRRW